MDSIPICRLSSEKLGSREPKDQQQQHRRRPQLPVLIRRVNKSQAATPQSITRKPDVKTIASLGIKRTNHDKLAALSLLMGLLATSVTSVAICGRQARELDGNNEVLYQHQHQHQNQRLHSNEAPPNCLHNHHRQLQRQRHFEATAQAQVHNEEPQHFENSHNHDQHPQAQIKTSARQYKQQHPLISHSIESSSREVDAAASRETGEQQQQQNNRRSEHRKQQQRHYQAPPCSDCLAIPLVAMVGDKRLNGYLIPPRARVQQLRKQTSTASTSSENQPPPPATTTTTSTNSLANNDHQLAGGQRAYYDPDLQRHHDYHRQQQQRQRQHQHQLSHVTANSEAKLEQIMQHHEQQSATDQHQQHQQSIEPFKPKLDESCPMTGMLTVCDQIGSYPAEVILRKVEFAKRELKRSGAPFNIDSLFTDERDHSSEPFDDDDSGEVRTRKMATKNSTRALAAAHLATEAKTQPKTIAPVSHSKLEAPSYSRAYNRRDARQQLPDEPTNDSRNQIKEARQQNFAHNSDDFLNLVEQRAFQLPSVAKRFTADHPEVYSGVRRNRDAYELAGSGSRDVHGLAGGQYVSAERRDKYQPVSDDQSNSQRPVPYQGDSDDVRYNTNFDGEGASIAAIADAASTKDEVVAVSLSRSSSPLQSAASVDKVTAAGGAGGNAFRSGNQGDGATISGKLAAAAAAIYEPPTDARTATGNGKPKRKGRAAGGTNEGIITGASASFASLQRDDGDFGEPRQEANIDFSSRGGAIKSVSGLRATTTNKTTIGRALDGGGGDGDDDNRRQVEIATATVKRRAAGDIAGAAAELDVEISEKVKRRPRRQVSIVRVGASSGVPLRGDLSSPPSIASMATSAATPMPEDGDTSPNGEPSDAGDLSSRISNGDGGSSDSATDGSRDGVSNNGSNSDSNSNSDSDDNDAGPARPPEPICRTKSIYITPKAALNDKKQWRYVVNAPELNPRIRQIIRVDICESPFGPCSDQVSLPFGFSSQCKQKYSKKKLLALDSQSGLLEIDTFFIPSCCVCQLIPDQSSSLFSSLEDRGAMATSATIATTILATAEAADDSGAGFVGGQATSNNAAQNAPGDSAV